MERTRLAHVRLVYEIKWRVRRSTALKKRAGLGGGSEFRLKQLGLFLS
jgi:hypothetical protein